MRSEGRGARLRLQDSKMRLRLLAIAIVHPLTANAFCIRAKFQTASPFQLLWFAGHDGEIGFLNQPFGKRLAQRCGRWLRLGGDNDARRLRIEAVDQPWRYGLKGSAFLSKPFR